MFCRAMFVIVLVFAGAVGFAFGNLNCSFSQCVEVGVKTNKDGKNTLCWLTFFDSKTNTYSGQAWGVQHAANGYGTDSKGGTPEDQKESYWYSCDGDSDCAPVAITPVSGTVTKYTGTFVNGVKTYRKCPGSGS